MGHYVSEMKGPPFTTKIQLPKKIAKKAGEAILNKQKLVFKKVESVVVEWVTGDPKRIWFEVSYDMNAKGDSGYVTTFGYNEGLQFLAEAEISKVKELVKKKMEKRL